MLTLKEWMELVDYRITEGSEWHGNIPDMYCLDSWSGDQDGYSFTIGFSLKDQRVYFVEACDYQNSRAYRLKDPGIEMDNQAWDNTEWRDLEVDDDFIQKALAIKAGENYDTRVSVPLELEDELLFELMKQAHEQDITLNQMVEQVLREVIEREGVV